MGRAVKTAPLNVTAIDLNFQVVLVKGSVSIRNGVLSRIVEPDFSCLPENLMIKGRLRGFRRVHAVPRAIGYLVFVHVVLDS